MNILVSGCLMGMPCRYDGKQRQNDRVMSLMDEHHLIPICPEQIGGLMTPRDPAERKENGVFTESGIDVTEAYVKGAKETLRLAKLYDCKVVILKEKSPSCGSGKIYDGTFSGKVVAGNGVTAELLKEHGIMVIGETEVKDYFRLAN